MTIHCRRGAHHDSVEMQKETQTARCLDTSKAGGGGGSATTRDPTFCQERLLTQ